MRLSSPALRRLLLVVLALSALWGASGCATPVAAGLDEGEADRVEVALERANVEASKEADPAADGKFRVMVARDDVAPALSAMRDEGLPRAKSPGVLDAVGKGALVTSEAAEHAEVVAGMAGDLERTLESIDGVLSARVHLSVPEPAGMFAHDLARPRPSASVLLEHQGAAPPIAVDEVQRLVAGGVTGLAPADVAVITVSRPAPPSPGRDMARIGPIAVARGSARALQAALVALVALVAILAAVTLFLYSRLTRLRRDLIARERARAAAS
jgi:type III secretion protein J